jgi:hypothetical protein
MKNIPLRLNNSIFIQSGVEDTWFRGILIGSIE